MAPDLDLQAFFPHGVIYEAVPVAMPGAGEVTDRERACVASAVLKRQREFLCGRAAARRLLHRLGAPAEDLLVGSNRAPLWPEGVVGSISHCDTLCLVAVARSAELAGIGVDCEPDAPLDAELWPRIGTPAELAWLERQAAAERGRWARWIFAAKEAAYKYQHPRTGVFLGFQDLAVRFTADGAFDLLAAGAPPLAATVLAGARGVYRHSGGHLVCAVIPASADASNPS